MTLKKQAVLALIAATILITLLAIPVLPQQGFINMVEATSLILKDYSGLATINNAPGDNPTVLPVTLQVVDKPDLVISEKHEEWVNLDTKMYNIVYTVKNQGSATAANSTTGIYIDSILKLNRVCPSLAPGASAPPITLGPYFISGDSDTIKICADNYTFIDESNEGNNCFENTWTFPTASYNITLAAGWNLISLPLIPDNTDIDAVISAGNLASGNAANIALVYHYNTITETWMWWNGTPAGNLHTMEDGLGYWLYATVADMLTVHGTEAGHPGQDYPVLSGWEIIGFTSTVDMAPDTYLASEDGNYTLLYRWADGSWWWWMKNNTASTFSNMEPGYGYWLNMTTGGTITPP